MIQTRKGPFRADHVGSFLRPAALKEARAKFTDGDITKAELRKVEDIEIEKLVAKQKKLVWKWLQTENSDVNGGI